MSHRDETLSAQIEQLVRTHIEATRREATKAVERAFPAVPVVRTIATPTRKPAGTTSRRRTPAELSALSERLYEAVRAQPGETMMVLAPTLGCSALELAGPMLALRSAGRVRSVGQRHRMRYYPTVAGPAT